MSIEFGRVFRIPQEQRGSAR